MKKMAENLTQKEFFKDRFLSKQQEYTGSWLLKTNNGSKEKVVWRYLPGAEKQP